jgi:hypothetical protein
MMARITTTTQKKKTMMPGIAYPETDLALATAASYPTTRYLFAGAVISDVAGQRRTNLGFLMACACESQIKGLRGQREP